jgi:DNA-binding response OmpR family regulator
MAVRDRAGARERATGPEVARVLLMEDDVTARLALQAVLQASGFAVDSAASVPEAMDKLEKRQYELVLCGADTREECRRVVSHARAQDYKPATAYLTTSGTESKVPKSGRLLIEPLEIPDLLTKIADLLAARSAGRERRNMRRRAQRELVAAH